MDEESADRADVPGHRLLHVIGAGSSSIVWAGADATGRPVAIKVPRTTSDLVTAREAQIERHVLMAVRHEHLVPLRDAVPLEDGRVALVFDHVVGATLASLVVSRGHLGPGEVVTVVTPIAEAVAALHAAGGTHCDIAPGNVMLTADGRPLLMDLGAARLAGTGAGAVVGTPGFVAPEVRSGDRPSEASDVFALGALAWFCRTGNGAPDTFMRLSEETLTSHLGPELAPVVGRCLDPEPETRPTSAALPAMFFEAAAAEPVEVVLGADDASALTHRIRAEAAAAEDVPAEDGSRPWYRRVPVGRPRWSRRLAALTGVAGLAVVIGGLAHVGVIPGTGAASRPATRVATHPSETVAPPGASPSVPAPPASASSEQDARALLQDLTDRRVAALVERNAGSLAAVHRAESPSWRADTALIAALTKTHQRYSGLRMTVAGAEFMSRSASSAVVRARVAVASYEVVDDAGAAVSKGGEQGEPLDFHLARTGAGWRIESISSPRAT